MNAVTRRVMCVCVYIDRGFECFLHAYKCIIVLDGEIYGRPHCGKRECKPMVSALGKTSAAETSEVMK